MLEGGIVGHDEGLGDCGSSSMRVDIGRGERGEKAVGMVV